MIDTVSFPAMGNTAVIQIDVAHAHLLQAALARVLQLEARWSRFEPRSEISILNASNGAATSVSSDTAFLLRHMQEAHEVTLGLFDPTMLHAIHAAGYISSRTSALTSSLPSPANSSSNTKSSIQDVTITRLSGSAPREIAASTPEGFTVTLPLGLTLDPGAIGKGAAADLVANELVAAGATDVCVSIGGDLSFVGAPRSIPVLSPFSDDPVATVAFSQGGVATSSITAKQLANGHHVIDPRTQLPTTHNIAQATVVTSSSAWAEALATACLVAGDTRIADALGVGALLVTRDGAKIASSHWEELDV